MDRQTYEKYYPYGAYTLGDIPQNAEIHRKRYQNFQDFLDANPLLVPKDYLGTDQNHCQIELIIGGRYRCGYKDHLCHNYPMTDLKLKLWNHKHTLRFKGQRNTYIVASHPYTTPDTAISKSQAISDELVEGLQAELYPAEKSWYYPRVSCLFLIGRPDILSRISRASLGDPIEIFEGKKTYIQRNK